MVSSRIDLVHNYILRKQKPLFFALVSATPNEAARNFFSNLPDFRL
jgi:hypothetical protein